MIYAHFTQEKYPTTAVQACWDPETLKKWPSWQEYEIMGICWGKLGAAGKSAK